MSDGSNIDEEPTDEEALAAFEAMTSPETKAAREALPEELLERLDREDGGE